MSVKKLDWKNGNLELDSRYDSQFVNYLKATKKYINSSNLGRGLPVVIGNEACDLDSAVCALVYAYHLHTLKCNYERTTSKRSFIPILNIPRDDYALRTEVKFWLKKHEVLEEYLIFRDDLNLKSQLTDRGLELTLVDHNVLPANDLGLERAVVHVLDHHKLEKPIDSLPKPNENVSYTEKLRRVPTGLVVEMVGSCATLVTESIKEKNTDILEDNVARLLLGTILLDTVNLSEEAKRATPKDIEMVLYLERYIRSYQPYKYMLVDCDRDRYFKDLTTAKADVSTLKCGQLLRKDVKVAGGTEMRVGVASVPMLAKDFLGRSDTNFPNLREHCQLYEYNILVVMGINIMDKTVERDIAIFSEDSSLLNEMSSYLISASDSTLNLSSFECDIKDVKAFSQGNYAASRKVVLPIIKEWLTGH